MDKKIRLIINKKKYFFIFIIFLLCACEKEKPNNVFKKAIELTENNHVIKDSLKKIRSKGCNFLVCYVNFSNEYNILNFSQVNDPQENIYPYKVKSNFEIKTIEGIDILFKDVYDTIDKLPEKVDEKTKKLLKNKVITFNGPNRFSDYDFIQFVFCKNDSSNYRFFNNKMESDEQNRVHEIDKPYYRESFYPRCD